MSMPHSINIKELVCSGPRFATQVRPLAERLLQGFGVTVSDLPASAQLPSTPSPAGFLRPPRSGRDSYSSGFDALAYSSHAAPACACVVGCEFFWSARHWLGEVPSQWWNARKKELASA